MPTDDPATILVTGVGSMPGSRSDEATRIVVGELDVPHVVELPARGPGSDMIGRALALVSQATGEFAAETTPSGWRLSGGRSGGEPGRSMRRGVSWLVEDLDRLEEQLVGFTGTVKVAVVGPWTLAAALESTRGTRMVADAAACADLATALAETIAEHRAAVARRVPGAQIIVQLDEPGLPAVLAGHIRTASGRGALRVPEVPEAVALLTAVISAAKGEPGPAGWPASLVHCCARDVPFEVLERAGVEGVSVDAVLLGPSGDEALGRWWDRGGLVLLGIAPSVDPVGDRAVGPTAESLARQVQQTWNRIGFGAADVAERTWLTPTCGLAGGSPAWARAVGGLLRGAAKLLDSAD